MYNLLIYDLHIICMYTMYMFYITQRICIYNSWFVCVSVYVCDFFLWLDWSYRSEDCIFAILITLNISYQECTLSAWLNWWCKPWPPAEVISQIFPLQSPYSLLPTLLFRRWSQSAAHTQERELGVKRIEFSTFLRGSVYENLQHSLGQEICLFSHLLIYSIIYISKNSWIFILCFMQGHIILLLRLFQVWPLVWLFQIKAINLSVNPCFLDTLHSFNLKAPLYSLNTTRSPGLTLYIPCPSPRISHLSK